MCAHGTPATHPAHSDGDPFYQARVAPGSQWAPTAFKVMNAEAGPASSPHIKNPSDFGLYTFLCSSVTSNVFDN